MSTAIVTGAGGLVGSAAVRRLTEDGWDVVGIENNMRARFFGPEGSTADTTRQLESDGVVILNDDIRDSVRMEKIVKSFAPDLLIHTAAQPSHDWAAGDPHADFTVNANGTLSLLQAMREHAIDSPFCHISTSKVYGDAPNRLPLRLSGTGTRYDLSRSHRYYEGIDTSMSIDGCLHSLFGVSKASGDLLVQEYGRYFDMPTIALRPGCVTGAGHAGVELHGWLSYLVKCCAIGRPYTVYGYDGYQVRCNIDARDLVGACMEFARAPVECGKAYNIGGGRLSNCSMREAIVMVEEIVGEPLTRDYDPTNRIGDHKWWISSNQEFRRDYPGWMLNRNVSMMIREIYEAGVEHWT